jgi:hypothetical protein
MYVRGDARLSAIVGPGTPEADESPAQAITRMAPAGGVNAAVVSGVGEVTDAVTIAGLDASKTIATAHLRCSC